VRLLLVASAGAVGALCRYGVGTWVGERSFPWATLAINVVGSFLIGVVLTVAPARHWSDDLRTTLAVGLIGSFTTFSTFAWEGIGLGRDGRVPAAALYLVASVGLGLLAGVAGLTAGTALAR
jgi:CrcB protein